MPVSNTPARILVVDDDPCLLRLLELRLSTSGYDVEAVPDGEQALASLAVRPPDLMITDLKMDGLDGMALFQRVRALHPTVPVIILTAHGTVDAAVEATQNGAFGFLTKPCGSARLLAEVGDALAHTGRSTASAGGRDDDWRAGFLSRNPELNSQLGDLRRVASTSAGVLLSGESGTGKRTLARAIHRASPRAGGPFVSINCGAMPEPVLADELFGGPANDGDGGGAVEGGQLAAAAGGTLYLEDVERLPELLQVRLLRALEHWSARAGSSAAPDVRVIAATREDLEHAVAEEEFREDLYYRLNGVHLHIQALRERPEDVALLAEHFLQVAAGRTGEPAGAFSRDAMRLLQQAPWPGNVRQLRNVIDELAALAPGGVVSGELVARKLRDGSRPFVTLNEARGAFERDYLIRLLRAVNANVTEAARIAGRNRTEFYRLLQRHQLEPRDFRPVS